jgi:hypothetical protein
MIFRWYLGDTEVRNGQDCYDVNFCDLRRAYNFQAVELGGVDGAVASSTDLVHFRASTLLPVWMPRKQQQRPPHGTHHRVLTREVERFRVAEDRLQVEAGLRFLAPSGLEHESQEVVPERPFRALGDRLFPPLDHAFQQTVNLPLQPRYLSILCRRKKPAQGSSLSPPLLM